MFGNKKGFTLIELLAVIIILAVIMLIATPIIMNVIDDSRSGAAVDSMHSYLKAIDLAIVDKTTELQTVANGTYTTTGGHLYLGTVKKLDILIKGNRPANGGSVIISGHQVTKAVLTFDGIKVTYDGENVSA